MLRDGVSRILGRMPHTILDSPLAIIDVETTGMSYTHGGVIDIGVLRIEHGEIVQSFHQLVNPGTAIPSFITQLTGITNDELATSPSFETIATPLHDILEGCIFVAHNVRFDYAFIKEEFRRVGMVYSPRQLCTVKLSRLLYPMHQGHKLANLIERFGIVTSERHRALADARATWHVLEAMVAQKGQEVVEAAARLQIRRPAIPVNIREDAIDQLPESAGVYIFEGETGAALYVGKSVNIKQRVMSHFSSDHRSAKELRIVQEIAHIRTIQTPGELSALLTESRVIKELMPLHNRMLRRKSEMVLVLKSTSAQGYPLVTLERRAINIAKNAHDSASSALDDIMAIYKSEREAKEALLVLAKEYQLCHKLLGLQKTSGACFMHQLNVCRGACIGKESAFTYQTRLYEAFAKTRLKRWPFPSPIQITESSSSNQASAYIIDQWCVLGVIAQEGQRLSFTAQERKFDVDDYKILKRYVEGSKNQVRIKLVSSQELITMRKMKVAVPA
jgi:DNA polymerase-3 subunit epsilon